MTKRSRRFLFFLFILISSFTSGSNELTLRQFDDEAMTTYSESGAFSYMELRVRPPSIWQRLQWWFGNLLAKIFSNPNAPWLSDLIFYGLLFLVVGVAIFYIVKLRYGGGIISNSRHFHSGNVPAIDSVKTTDFDSLIEDSLKAKNFKLAIRYIYLKSLAFLAEKELVRLKDWKSPYDYEKELSTDLIPVYRDLSQLFEYVWYGDFNAKEADFRKGSELLVKIKEEAK
ncbi:MAG: DUF4129 domain-containing protein [Cyclobacteriaceae bacterium]